MNCYICAGGDKEQVAVGVCRFCSITLCMAHLEEAQTHTQGGMRLTCNHAVQSQTRPGQEAAVKREGSFADEAHGAQAQREVGDPLPVPQVQHEKEG